MKIMSDGEPYFITFANNCHVLFAEEAQSRITMKKGETLKQSTAKYVKNRHEDSEKRIQVGIALESLLCRLIADEILKDSDELGYFINLFLREPENPIRYEVSDGKLRPIYDTNPDNLGWYRALRNSLQSFLMDKAGLRKRLKRCPYCNIFFIAKDTKRKICYEKVCKNKYHKEDMEKRRDLDPVKYC